MTEQVEAVARAICEAKGYDPDAPIDETRVQWQAFTELAKSTVVQGSAALPSEANLTRPIIGIGNRAAQEVFDIMCDRIRSAMRATTPTAPEAKCKCFGDSDFCASTHERVSDGRECCDLCGHPVAPVQDDDAEWLLTWFGINSPNSKCHPPIRERIERIVSQIRKDRA